MYTLSETIFGSEESDDTVYGGDAGYLDSESERSVRKCTANRNCILRLTITSSKRMSTKMMNRGLNRLKARSGFGDVFVTSRSKIFTVKSSNKKKKYKVTLAYSLAAL